ncbi:ABC transporter permease [Pseudobacteriovorax antillogorgiicola]|uniref:ABC-2 type transport system permease protein n=1 Tax=Pseudobacteriovorax antillogorgiicola TaxID=1513793 RepID=A0A1Y6CGR8_9BACT|nr:ABC-2 family transporter protein [Pseudobacteriovorax antillogorgiicola]TCS47335.1 ABC-2 type transport system permease protein [Pseudobacteriovorax antillogorgiicola]SMF63090.1 ABC-2 type transport system permease protein [Pseudobacteriovorax antillogorgiicola]
MKRLRKWWQTMTISMTKQMAYKTNFLLLMIGPSLVFFFIKYNVWTAIFETQGASASIEGYTLTSMLQYQAWVLIVALFAQSYNSMSLAEEIRLGRISSYLVYPFNFWEHHAASFLGLLVIQSLICGVSIIVFNSVDLLGELSIITLFQGFCLAFLVAILWYALNFLMGIIAFWLEETWVLRVMFLTISQFFSGSLLPLEVFPQWLREIVMYTPFPYLTWAPVKAFMGELSIPLEQGILVILFWIGVSAILATFTWSRGVRLYTAAGM